MFTKFDMIRIVLAVSVLSYLYACVDYEADMLNADVIVIEALKGLR